MTPPLKIYIENLEYQYSFHFYIKMIVNYYSVIEEVTYKIIQIFIHMTSNLATQLREGTSKSHSMAENVSFVKSFLGGVIDKESYRKLVSNLYFVYFAMEEEMEKNKNNPFIFLKKKI